MTPEQLVNAFIAAGLDTPQKVAGALGYMALKLQALQLEGQMQTLTVEQQAAAQAAENARAEIAAQLAAVNEQLRTFGQ